MARISSRMSAVFLLLLAVLLLLPMYASWLNAVESKASPSYVAETYIESAQQSLAVKTAREVGSFVSKQTLHGTMFKSAAAGGEPTAGMNVPMTWSVVAALSPKAEAEVKDMFQDDYSECTFHALGGALVRRASGLILLMHHLWLEQYYHKKRAIRMGQVSRVDVFLSFKNSWHENYLLSVEMNERYEPLDKVRLLNIPAPTNLEFYEERDGPLGPKYVEVDGRLYLSFYLWARELTEAGEAVAGRVHLWDMERKLKINLRVTGIKMKRSEIGWAPLSKNGLLYFVYDIEPLKVLHCTVPSGRCTVAFDADSHHFLPAGRRPSSFSDATAFVEYQYPFYIGIGHQKAPSHDPNVRLYTETFQSRIIVLCVEPWHLLYVSDIMAANRSWLMSVPVVRHHPAPPPSWHPTSVLLIDLDTIDLSAQLNDHSAYIVRLTGIKRLMDAVIRLGHNQT